MLKRRFKNQKGVSIIEFALVLPVLLLFLGGTIDFGIIFFINHMAGNAAREGARLAAISEPIDNARVEEKVRELLPVGGLFRSETISITSDLSSLVCEVRVNVSGEVPYFFLTLVEVIIRTGPFFPIDRTVIMRYEHCSSFIKGATDEGLSFVFMAWRLGQK